MKRLLALVLATLATPAIGEPLKVLETQTFVGLLNPDGTEEIRQATAFPLIPARVCYGWRIRLGGNNKLVKATEVFTLPGSPQDWGDIESDQFSPTKLSADRKTSTTTQFYTPEGGWIQHQWCVAPGDPAGKYVMSVSSDDQPLGTFEPTAQAVAPDQNAGPPAPPAP